MNTCQFMRGVGLGVAVGAAIGAACAPKKHRSAKQKKARHAMKLIADCVEDLSAAMGL